MATWGLVLGWISIAFVLLAICVTTILMITGVIGAGFLGNMDLGGY